MNDPRAYATYASRTVGLPARVLFGTAAGLALVLLADIPAAVRASVTVLLWAAATLALGGIVRRIAGVAGWCPLTSPQLIASAVGVAAVLAVAPSIYGLVIPLTPLVTVFLLVSILMTVAKLRTGVRLPRSTAGGFAVAMAAAVAVVAIPRMANSGGQLTYPTPPSASLAFAGHPATRATPEAESRALLVSVVYTPLSGATGAPVPRARFGDRVVAAVSTRWFHATEVLTYRLAGAARGHSGCLRPFVVTAPPGSPGARFPADGSRAPLRIELWVGASTSTTICGVNAG